MKNKSFLKIVLIILGVIIAVWILATAIFLLVGPIAEGGPAIDQSQLFLQALQGEDYAKAYQCLSDNAKREVGHLDDFEGWVKRNNLQVKSWMPPMSKKLDDKTTGVVVTANFANGKQEPLMMVLVESGIEWKVNYFGRPPK